MLFNLKLLENGYLRVAVVGSSENKRMQMLTAFNGLKFQDVKGFTSFDDLHESIRKGHINWVLGTYTDESGKQITEFLDELYSGDIGHPVIVSAMLSTNEMIYIPKAFASGLFSWHPDKGVSEYTRQSLWRLKRKAGQVNGLASMIPYLFYRSYLKQKSLWDEHVDLCEQMIRSYRYEDVIKLHLVEAYIRAGYGKKGRGLLREIEYFEPSLAGQISEVRKNVLGDEQTKNETLAQRYNVKHAVVVQGKVEAQNQSKDILKAFGFNKIDCFSDGDKAWPTLEREKIDLLVMDWDLEGTTGCSLLQRVRISAVWDYPVIVFADKVTPADSQIINQYSVAEVLPTQSSKNLKGMAISWALVQSKEPTEALGIEAKIYERLGKKDVARAHRYFEKFLKVASRDPSKEKYLKAHIDLAEGHFLDAKYLLLEANVDSKVNSIKIDTLMARCLLELGDFQGVLNLLKRIKKQSPKSIMILGILARAYARLGDLENASSVIREALKLDEGHPWIKQNAVKIYLAMDDLQSAKNRITNADLVPVVKDSSNLASLYCDSKMQEKGVNLFKTLIDFVQGTEAAEEFEPIIRYNLALAYARQGDDSLAKNQLSECMLFKNSLVFELASELKENILALKEDGLFFFTFSIEEEHTEVQTEEGKITNEILNTGDAIDLDDRVFLRGVIANNSLRKAV